MNDGLFELFWAAGMRKVAKKSARKAFDRATKESTLTPEEFANMLVFDVLERLDIKQYGFDRLHPASYLNGERWEDEKVNDNEEFKQPTFQGHTAIAIEHAKLIRAKFQDGGASERSVYEDDSVVSRSVGQPRRIDA